MNDGITEWKYEGADIFTVNEDVVSMGTVKEYTITADALMQKITLGSFKLDTLEDYESFNTVLGRAQIQITVSEVVAP